MNNLLISTGSPVTLRVPDFKRVWITLVGCGGTGSHIASGLVAIAQALNERSIGIDMLFVDPDVVEVKNVGRQLFSHTDIGQPKAEALAGRLNAAFGMRIMSAVRSVDVLDILPDPTHRDVLSVVIGAVDNPAARAAMAEGVKSGAGQLWWLDCGNENHSGQVCIGNATEKRSMRGAIALGMVDRLPGPSVVWPDLIFTAKAQRRRGKKLSGLSCAELAAAGEQSLMINRVIAGWACSMLHDFVVTRDLRFFSVAIDLRWGGMRTYAIDAPTIAEVCGLKMDEVMVKGQDNDKKRIGRNARPVGQRRRG